MTTAFVLGGLIGFERYQWLAIDLYADHPNWPLVNRSPGSWVVRKVKSEFQ